MRRIATISGARTFAADAGDELATVYERLGSQVATREEEREITAAFAGGAAAFLLLGGRCRCAGSAGCPGHAPAIFLRVRRVAIVAVAVAGIGLFGTGVRGLAQLDDQLADAADRPATRDVKRELGQKGDCPWRERDRSVERQRSRQPHRPPPARPRARGSISERAAVRLAHGAHDREARARRRGRRPRAPGARTAPPAAPRRRRSTGGPLFSTRSSALPIPSRVRTSHEAAGPVVAHAVLDQVGRQPLEQRGVALDRGRPELGRRAARPRGPPRSAASPRPRRRRAPGRPARVAAGRAGSAPGSAGSRAAPRCGGSPAPRTRPCARSSSRSGSGLASATSASERITVSGLRSSWLALATKRRCVSNETASRSSIELSVSPSSRSSSSGPLDGDALAEALLGDPPGGAAHPLERREHPPGDDPADHAGHQQHADERDHVLERDLVERVARQRLGQRAVEVAAEQPVADQQEDARSRAPTSTA